MKKLSRRNFLKDIGAAAATLALPKPKETPVDAEIVDDTYEEWQQHDLALQAAEHVTVPLDEALDALKEETLRFATANAPLHHYSVVKEEYISGKEKYTWNTYYIDGEQLPGLYCSFQWGWGDDLPIGATSWWSPDPPEVCGPMAYLLAKAQLI